MQEDNSTYAKGIRSGANSLGRNWLMASLQPQPKPQGHQGLIGQLATPISTPCSIKVVIISFILAASSYCL